jgi:polysaccharide export outer membrane protein
LVLLLVGGLSALGCMTSPTPAPPTRYEPYRVGAPDVLSITILPEPIIQEEVVVRPDGMITVQLVGDVLAGRRTPSEVAAEIEERIAKFKRGAKVTIALAAAQSSAITIFGEVRNPGAFALVKDTRIAEAIGNMGGPTNFARLAKVRVVRPSAGQPIVLMVNMRAISKGDMSTNIQLAQGDIVYVPPTLWARFGYAMNALLFPFQPLMGILRSSIGTALVL